MRARSSLVFALTLGLSLRGGVVAAPAPRDALLSPTMLHATPRFQNCTSTELQTLDIALEDAVYLANLGSHALSLLTDNGPLDVEMQRALNISIVTPLTKRWFGAEVLEDSQEGREKRSYIRSIYERTVDSFANNAFDLDYYCNPPGVSSKILAYVGLVRDAEQGIKYKEKYKNPQRGDINVAELSWHIPKSLNVSLQDPKRNYDWTDRLPLGTIILHEQVHAMPFTGERQIDDVCIPCYGLIGSGWFTDHAMAWVDSELAVHNAGNYAGFATDLAQSVYTGEVSRVLFETCGAGAIIERKQESIDGVISILRKYDNLESVIPVFVAPSKSPPTSEVASVPLQRRFDHQFDGYCNELIHLDVGLSPQGECTGFRSHEGGTI